MNSLSTNLLLLLNKLNCVGITSHHHLTSPANTTPNVLYPPLVPAMAIIVIKKSNSNITGLSSVMPLVPYGIPPISTRIHWASTSHEGANIIRSCSYIDILVDRGHAAVPCKRYDITVMVISCILCMLVWSLCSPLISHYFYLLCVLFSCWSGRCISQHGKCDHMRGNMMWLAYVNDNLIWFPFFQYQWNTKVERNMP